MSVSAVGVIDPNAPFNKYWIFFFVGFEAHRRAHHAVIIMVWMTSNLPHSRTGPLQVKKGAGRAGEPDQSAFDYIPPTIP